MKYDCFIEAVLFFSAPNFHSAPRLVLLPSCNFSLAHNPDKLDPIDIQSWIFCIGMINNLAYWVLVQATE